MVPETKVWHLPIVPCSPYLQKRLEDLEQDMYFLGMAGMIDPPREEVKIAIGECKTAGIHTVMITGDHPETAAAIARQISLADGALQVMSGAELEKIPDQEFSRRAEHIHVYARVSPEQKLKIVKALQAGNNYVAMTGDGVNDAPPQGGQYQGGHGHQRNRCQQEADASHDDHFATIVKAVAKAGGSMTISGNL
jgi:Ca2+-transporting ATPase